MRSLVVNRCASIRDIVSMLEKQTQCKILHWFEKRRGGGGGGGGLHAFTSHGVLSIWTLAEFNLG